MSGLAAAALRVARAPGLVALAAALHLLLAWTVGSATRAAVGRSVEPYALFDNDRLGYAALELLGTSPGLLGPLRHLLAGSAAIAVAFWTLLAAGVIHRLRAPAPLPRLAAAAVRGVPAVVAVSLWHLALRAVLLAVVGAPAAELIDAGSWGLAGLLAVGLALAFCTCALDLARCAAVLHGAPGYHPRTAWRGFLHAARRPAVLARSMLLSFGQWACLGAVLLAAFAGLGGGPAIWLARAGAILAVVLGLTRLAVAVEAGPYRGRVADRVSFDSAAAG